MKFENKFILDEILATNFGGDLVKVKGVTFTSDGIHYTCRTSDGRMVMFMENELNNDDEYADIDAIA